MYLRVTVYFYMELRGSARGEEGRLTGSTGQQESGLGPLCQLKHMERSHERRFQGLDRVDLIMRR